MFPHLHNIPITKLEENPDIFTTLITDYITLVTVLYLAT